MPKALIAWIGHTDLRASTGDELAGNGPIAQALENKRYGEAYLLANYAPKDVTHYIKWLRQRSKAEINVTRVSLDSPTNFGKIHEAAVGLLEQIRKEKGQLPDLTFHLSPGTPAMAAVWILLSKTRYPAELIESKQHGVSTVSVPFDISAEYLPTMFRGADERLAALSVGLPPEAPEFDAIIHRSPQMKRVVTMARRVAMRSVPVLIEGESGTGKELLARAIHNGGPKALRDRLLGIGATEESKGL